MRARFLAGCPAARLTSRVRGSGGLAEPFLRGPGVRVFGKTSCVPEARALEGTSPRVVEQVFTRVAFAAGGSMLPPWRARLADGA